MDLEQIRQGPSIFQRSEIAHPVAVAVGVVVLSKVGMSRLKWSTNGIFEILCKSDQPDLPHFIVSV